jgi:uncharacterized protein YoxC
MASDSVASRTHTLTRRQNALAQDTAEKAPASGTSRKGLDQSFAATLQISPSMWSQIKSSRPIGDKLARQIEQLMASRRAGSTKLARATQWRQPRRPFWTLP